MEATPYHTGQIVVTRRGKRGRVVECRATTVLVQFGSYEPIELRHGQVIAERSYTGMLTGTRRQADYR